MKNQVIQGDCLIYMNKQNSYGPVQYCSKCEKPLEKARTKNIDKAVCISCQRKAGREYYADKITCLNKNRVV